MKKSNIPYIFVIGNEKGGVGKTTCAMHLIVGLLDYGLRVGSIDVDFRQHSLTSYLNNRYKYNEKNSNTYIKMPYHVLMSCANNVEEDRDIFIKTLTDIMEKSDVVVIDTPGNNSFLSCLAHSYANTVITPINDSFLDIDVLAKIDGENPIFIPSIYSEMLWKQKLEKANRNSGVINWVVLCNRLSNFTTLNKKRINKVLEELSKRINFKIAPGFKERSIFKELFLQGLTLLDIIKCGKSLTVSHIAARQELRNFFKFLELEKLS